METIFADLGRTGLDFEEAVRRGTFSTSATFSRSSSSELGSPEHLEQLNKTSRIVANTSFRKKKDIDTSVTTKARNIGAKFEHLGKTTYSSGEWSKPVPRRRLPLPSSQTSVDEEGGSKKRNPEKKTGPRRNVARRTPEEFPSKKTKSNRGSILFSDDSSDELNLTSSSQPIEVPTKHSSPSSERASGPPDSDSEGFPYQQAMHSYATRYCTSPPPPVSPRTSSRLISDNFRKTIIDDRTPVKKRKIRPRPANRNAEGKHHDLPPTNHSMETNRCRPNSRTSEENTHAHSFTKKCSSSASSSDPIRALLEEKRMDEETPQPTRIIKDKLKKDPASFPMTKEELTHEIHATTKANRKTTPAPFLLSGSGDPSSDRGCANTKRGELVPFPMALQGRKLTSSSKNASESANLGDQSTKRKRSGSDAIIGFEDSNDFSFTQAVDRPDPRSLCPYCDMPFPPNPSPLLLSMLKRIPQYPDPRPTNPLGLTAPLLSYISMCQRHQFEMKLLPTAIAAGWPTYIDFAALPDRITALHDRLADILHDKEKSVFWCELRKNITEKGLRKAMGLTGQFSSFEDSQPGYYGEQGSVIISQMLANLFPLDSIDGARVSPLTPAEFVRHVVVPECAVALIQEDLGERSSLDLAIHTLRESRKYGTTMFPDLDNRDGLIDAEGCVSAQRVGEGMVKERVRARQKEIDEARGMEAKAGMEQCGNRKNGKSKRPPKKTEVDTSDADADGSFRNIDGKKKRGKSKSSSLKHETNNEVIDVSDSSSIHPDSSVRSLSKKAINRKAPTFDLPAESEEIHPTKAVQKRMQPRPATLRKANGRALGSDASHISSEAEEATPRPSRIRRDREVPDFDAALRKNDIRIGRSLQSRAAESKPVRGLKGSLQPLQAARKRKSTKESVFRHNMWENDECETEESESLPSLLPSDGDWKGRKGRTESSSSTRKSSSWLFSDPSTPSDSP